MKIPYGYVQVIIPKELQKAIVRIQAKKDLEFDEAAYEAAMLVDPRRKEFNDQVKKEADRLNRVQYFQQLNKTRINIRNDGYSKGTSDTLNKFTYPCIVCDQPIILGDNSWKSAREYLIEQRWGHAKCVNRSE